MIGRPTLPDSAFSPVPAEPRGRPPRCRYIGVLRVSTLRFVIGRRVLVGQPTTTGLSIRDNLIGPPTLTVSVLPVPAGPSGLPPRCRYIAVVRVSTHRSVRGVTTSLPLLPCRSRHSGRDDDRLGDGIFVMFSGSD